MQLPKVKFTNSPRDREADLIYHFLFEVRWGWESHITKKHPEIKEVFSFKSEEERVDFLEKYIADFNKENKELIKKNKEEYRRQWRKIEEEFLIELANIMQTDWPKNRTDIKAMISINPICPRFLDEWSFTIFYNYQKITYAMETIMHEICHFLYFEKWKQLYPQMDPEKFESPYIEWHLSEIMAPVILSDKRIQKLLKQKPYFYNEHRKIIIENKDAPQYFIELYEKHKEKEEDFGKFLQDAYRVIQKNKSLFLNI
jgi:hypothetical protein